MCLDGGHQICIVWLDHGSKPPDDVARFADKKLFKVPADVTRVAFGIGRGCEFGVDRMAAFAVEFFILKKRESHTV